MLIFHLHQPTSTHDRLGARGFARAGLATAAAVFFPVRFKSSGAEAGYTH